MLELGACMEETKAKSIDLVESTDADFSDISFEEFLAKEKKDSFWFVLDWDLNYATFSYRSLVDNKNNFHVQAEKWEI